MAVKPAYVRELSGACVHVNTVGVRWESVIVDYAHRTPMTTDNWAVFPAAAAAVVPAAHGARPQLF